MSCANFEHRVCYSYVFCYSLMTVVFKHPPQGMRISVQNKLSQVNFALIRWFYLLCVLCRSTRMLPENFIGLSVSSVLNILRVLSFLVYRII
jgi:hypothetical protein